MRWTRRRPGGDGAAICWSRILFTPALCSERSREAEPQASRRQVNRRIRHREGTGARVIFGRMALAGRWIALASFLICSDANPALAATPKTTWFGDLRERVILSPALESAMATYVAAAIDGREPPKDAARLIADTKRAP